MRTSMLCSILIILMISSTSAAELDTVTDGMGIFFDTEASLHCLDYYPSQGVTTITAHMLLINPSTIQPTVLAWEARLEVAGNPTVPIPSSWVVIGGTGWGYGGPDYIEGVNVPITHPITELAYLNVVFVGDETEPWLTISIGHIPGSTSFPDGPGYTAEVGHPIPGNPINAAWGEHSAWINHPDGPCATVANEPMTWSAVKNLYED
jgi:hypothetical protein